jgi:hypothetical protein
LGLLGILIGSAAIIFKIPMLQKPFTVAYFGYERDETADVTSDSPGQSESDDRTKPNLNSRFIPALSGRSVPIQLVPSHCAAVIVVFLAIGTLWWLIFGMEIISFVVERIMSLIMATWDVRYTQLG